MKIKDAVYATCGECKRQHEQISPEEYGCDECMQPINRGARGNHLSLLQATAHRTEGAPKDYEFCSWVCCLKGLSKVKTDYFITLPYLTYDEDQPGLRAQDFFAAYRQIDAVRIQPKEK